MQTRKSQIQEQPWNLNSACWKTLHKLIFNWKFQLLEYWRPLEALEKSSENTTPVWREFKNSFAWLTGMKKMIFCYSYFFGSGHFLTLLSNLMDQKRAGAKKVIKTKNQFFHVYQLRKGIFEFPSHRCCIFRFFFQSF